MILYLIWEEQSISGKNRKDEGEEKDIRPPERREYGMKDINHPAWEKTGPTLLECLSATPYDELIEYDLMNNRCRNLHHTEGKYFVPVLDGAMDSLCLFCVNNMVHPEDREKMIGFLDAQTLQERLKASPTPGILQTEVRYKLLDGSWSWTRQLLVGGPAFELPDGIVRGYLYDIQADKKYQEDREEYFSAARRRDERTGLINDRDLYAMVRKKIGRMQGDWCVIAIEIEHFSLFADWHGRAAADALAARIGGILRQTEQDMDGLAGYRGQDNFWLVIPYDLHLIHDLYEEIRDVVVEQGGDVGFLPIFGIAMLNTRESETEIFNHAAVTAAQIRGDLHNRIRTYNPSTNLQSADEHRLLANFREALKNGEIFFCLQPQCRVSTGRVVGAESLARWRLPDGSMVPPAKFVSILEKHGMVANLDQFIWESVCVWLRRWIDAGHTPVPISVNVSQIDILTIDVPAYFSMLLKKYDLPPKLLKVEITESAYVDDTALARNTVRRLRSAGFTVLMDDFGSGYSSLNMLSTLNVDILKLDAQFLRISKQEERKGISILESVVSMAKTMALPIIVEGVETQEQINFLEDLGCRYIQGYYFYRPMPVEEFERLIADEKRIDLRGVEFKSNNQIHPREFLDENVFSDAMLNNILGPVAIYQWRDDQVNIVRYNQQFYQMVGIPLHQLNERITNMQEYCFPEDKERLFRMLDAAQRDHLNGAKGMLRVYKPNGTLRWISVQLYYMSESEEGKMYYGSCEDVTELQFINVDMPGGYHRISADEKMEFRYVSSNFLDMVGYTRDELRDQFEDQFIRLVHPDDVEIVLQKGADLLARRRPAQTPFRIRHKGGGYIYVANQQIMTDLYGEKCFACVVTDVTGMVKMQGDMQLLADFSTDCIAFVRNEGGWQYEIIVYGMEKKLGMDQQAFLEAMNSGAFYSWVDPDQRVKLRDMTLEKMKVGEPLEFECDLTLPTGKRQRMRLKTDRAEANPSRVEYICVFHAL